jgi:hypothetical protein
MIYGHQYLLILKENLKFINGPIYDSMATKTKNLEQSIAPLMEYTKYLAFLIWDRVLCVTLIDY